MKITIENTEKIVELVIGSTAVPARIWEGETDTGIKVHCYITRIAAPAMGTDLEQFDRELKAVRAPSKEVEAIPLRLIL